MEEPSMWLTHISSFRYGRRRSTQLPVLLALVFSVVAGLSPNLYIYLVSQFITAATLGGYRINSIVLGMNLTSHVNVFISSKIIELLFFNLSFCCHGFCLQRLNGSGSARGHWPPVWVRSLQLWDSVSWPAWSTSSETGEPPSTSWLGRRASCCFTSGALSIHSIVFLFGSCLCYIQFNCLLRLWPPLVWWQICPGGFQSLQGGCSDKARLKRQRGSYIKLQQSIKRKSRIIFWGTNIRYSQCILTCTLAKSTF